MQPDVFVQPCAPKLIDNCCISIARIKVKGCRIPTDMHVEQSINKFGKSQGESAGGCTGFNGILTKPKCYQKWMRTAHVRIQIVEVAHRMADLLPHNDEFHDHKDTRKTQIMDHGEDVQRTMTAFGDSFMNPFTVPGNGLYIISSRIKVPDDIAKDIMCRDQWGVYARDKFIDDRLEGKAERPEDRDIHKAITQCKLWL